MRCNLVRVQTLLVVAKNQFCVRSLRQHMNHLVRTDPVVMISCQPSLRVRGLVVLVDVVLIRGKDPGATLRHVDLHDTEPWSVPGSVSDVNAWTQLKEIAAERLPIQVKLQVVREVDATITASRYGIKSVLELVLVDVNGYVSANEVL